MTIDTKQLLDTYLPLAMDYGIQIITAIIILLAGKWLAGIFAGFLRSQLDKRSVDPMVSSFVRSLVYWGLFAFAAIAALGQLGIQTASFIAVIGAAGLAVGLALQGSLSNFAAGVLILVFKPFKTGDYIEAGGQSGSVNEIKVFATLLVTPDNKEVLIPNSSILNGSITNYSARDTRRVDLSIGVSYDAHLPDVRKLLEEIVAAEPLILHEQNNLIAVAALADSSVNFVVRSWVNTADYWTVYFRLTETIKLKFDEAGIGIPYPQMDVHIQK